MSRKLLRSRPPFPRVNSSTSVTFHPISFRSEEEEYVIWVSGRHAFLAIPSIGKEVIDLLRSGKTIAQTETAVEKKYRTSFDVADFVKTLVREGFIKQIDNYTVLSSTQPIDRFRFFKPQQVSWLFGRASFFVVSFFIAITLLLLLLHPLLIPSRDDFFWTRSTTIIILSNVCLHFLFVFSHELAHLFAARALGVGGSMRFSTRLTSLVLQTDVTGIWAESRRNRMIVYVSGIVWNLMLIAVAVWLVFLINEDTLFVKLLKVSILLNGLSILSEFHLYMRTDIYFVLMDLLRCRNLFHDSLSYANYQLQVLIGIVKKRKEKPRNPIERFPVRERRSVAFYGVFAVVGSLVSLGIFVFYSVPIAMRLYVMAASSIISGLQEQQFLRFVDGVTTLLVEVLFIGLYFYAFVKNHPQMLAWIFKRDR
ncbi:MAG: hypothetical protein HYV40_00520 [Candidatus Levybacteria bacterium]|nr:hypothetical protein [Candidatus Levybacteria bacterium]